MSKQTANNQLVFVEEPGTGSVVTRKEWQQHLTKMNALGLWRLPKDQGLATLNGNGWVTVFSKMASANMMLQATPQDMNTLGTIRLNPTATVPGVSFQLNSTGATDQGVIFWQIF